MVKEPKKKKEVVKEKDSVLVYGLWMIAFDVSLICFSVLHTSVWVYIILIIEKINL